MPTSGCTGWARRCSRRWGPGRRSSRWRGISSTGCCGCRASIPNRAGALSAGAQAFLAASRHVPPRDVGRRCPVDRRVLRELEAVHRTMIAMHLEKTLKSDRVLRDLRRHAVTRRRRSHGVTLQDLISNCRLLGSQGCLLQQPLDLEVGAGTCTPRRSSACSAEALERRLRAAVAAPDDGRFGQNPNRLFKHHQFQVILKPAPDEVQQLYLESLEACGINPRSTTSASRRTTGSRRRSAPGASAGRCCSTASRSRSSPTSSRWAASTWRRSRCEITYGLERIAMFLQKVDNVYDLEWAPGVKYARGAAARRGRAVEVRVRRWTCRRGEFAAFHRDLFDRVLRLRRDAARLGLVLAGARALPEVLAPVQHPRRERQHRRDRAHGLHPARPAAGRRHREGLRPGVEPGIASEVRRSRWRRSPVSA
jgi:hypothetical protein